MCGSLHGYFFLIRLALSVYNSLKRKYASMDGRPASRLNLPFAAFELKFESRNEFVGIDNVHKNQVRYRRVQPETLI